MNALDLFTGKELEELCHPTHDMVIQNVSCRKYQPLDISNEKYLWLSPIMMKSRLPSGVGDKIIRPFSTEEKDTKLSS